jgi:hypothetical protein
VHYKVAPPSSAPFGLRGLLPKRPSRLVRSRAALVTASLLLAAVLISLLWLRSQKRSTTLQTPAPQRVGNTAPAPAWVVAPAPDSAKLPPPSAQDGAVQSAPPQAAPWALPSALPQAEPVRARPRPARATAHAPRAQTTPAVVPKDRGF